MADPKVTVEIIQGGKQLWSFKIDYHIPDNLYAARVSLDGFLFWHLREVERNNPVVQAVDAAAKTIHKMHQDLNALEEAAEYLKEECATLRAEKAILDKDISRLTKEIVNTVNHEPMILNERTGQPVDSISLHNYHTWQNVNRIPRWVKSILNFFYDTNL